MDFIKCDNSVANHSIVLKFGTVLVITVPNTFHYLTSIEMLTFLEIITNIGKNSLHLVTLKGDNFVTN